MSAEGFGATDYWRVEHEAGTTVVDGVTSAQPAPAIGDTPTWTLGFRGNTGVPTAFRERFDAIEAFASAAGTYAAERTINNKPVYVDGHGEESLLVALRPPDGDGRLRGAWGLVDDVGDKTNRPLTAWRLDLSLWYLGGLGDFEDRAAVRDAAERIGFH